LSENQNQNKEPHNVTIDTAKGQIVLEVYPDLMPITVANFDKLVQSGFYNGLKFHRVEDWVIQGGDPKGNGTGGPGWSIKLETNPQLRNVRGGGCHGQGYGSRLRRLTVLHPQKGRFLARRAVCRLRQGDTGDGCGRPDRSRRPDAGG
jgi:hypothetical protein